MQPDEAALDLINTLCEIRPLEMPVVPHISLITSRNLGSLSHLTGNRVSSFESRVAGVPAARRGSSRPFNGYAYGPTAILGGLAFSHERGTPVGVGACL
jgi:hypothetical protein